MATNPERLGVQSIEQRAADARKLVLPNPGDVMIFMIFGWAFFCFFMVIYGRRLLTQLAKLARSSEMRNLILSGDETLLTLLMLGGSTVIVCLVIFSYRYKYAFIGLLFYSLPFANASFKPLHDVALLIKYSFIAFLACFAALFIIKNFWKMISTPYLRLVVVYFAWVAAVSLGLGGKTDDIWYLGTDVALIFGLAIAYLGFVDSDEELYKFNMVIAWAAVCIAMTHATAPVLSADHIQGGRFQSFSNRATGFGIFYAPMLLSIYWAGMAAKTRFMEQFFTGLAMCGTLLLLWSGTRSATLALLIGIGMLWWIYRTRIFIYGFVAVVGVLVFQIVGGGISELEIEKLANRLGDTEDTGRFELWARYWEVFLRSPLYGHSLSGVTQQFFSSELVSFLESRGAVLKYQKPHNAYLGMAVRFGTIGLILLLLLLYYPLRRAWDVLMNPGVPKETKQVFVLPAALMALCCLCSLFEDAISATGKGTVTGFVVFPMAIILEMYGRKIIDKYGGRVENRKAMARQSERFREVGQLQGRGQVAGQAQGRLRG